MQDAAYSPKRPPQAVELPIDTQAVTHTFRVRGFEITVTAGKYESGRLGIILFRFGDEGALMNVMMKGFANTISVALQHGVPLEALAKDFILDPPEDDKAPWDGEVILDEIFRWLIRKFSPLDFDETVRE